MDKTAYIQRRLIEIHDLIYEAHESLGDIKLIPAKQPEALSRIESISGILAMADEKIGDIVNEAAKGQLHVN